jgi:phosphatidate cytidylyltransferase
MNRNVWQRLAVAALGIPVLVVVHVLGGIYFDVVFLIIAVTSVIELHKIFLSTDLPGPLRRAVQFGTLSIVFTGVFFVHLIFYAIPVVWLLLLVLSLRFIPVEKVSLLLQVQLAFFYPAVFWWFYIDLQHGSEYAGLPDLLALFVLISVWVLDTFAYFGGVTFGKNRIFPAISPKKSWEGAIAGFVGVVLFWYFVAANQWVAVSLPVAMVLAIAIGSVGQIGDFFESFIKRSSDQKDSSRLLPGHGGMLDRFDSLIFVAPFVWMLTKIFFN